MRKIKIAASRGRNPDDLSFRGKSNGRFVQVLEMREGDFSNTITTVVKDNYIVEYERDNNSGKVGRG